ncbi:MAG: zinc ribbon domain-containing protein [Verrucomicrobiota bacterium]|nr:zinc ribbon domain-containing protein [Verrucomicrobiota bacterium]
MPLYEYTCSKCHKRSEHLVRSVSEEHLPDCPNCGSRQMRKELSVFAASGGVPDPELPSCSGNPSNCVRCS